MGSPPVIPNGKGAAAVMVAAWASWIPAVSVVWQEDPSLTIFAFIWPAPDCVVVQVC